MVTQAKWALEADLWLRKGAARLAVEAKARVVRRAPLGELNAVAASAAATCGGARGALPVGDAAALADALDGDPRVRVAARAAPRVVAASALGDAAGAGVAPPANILEAAGALDALDGAEARTSVDDLRKLPSGRLRALAAQASSLVGDGARGGLRGAAPVASLDDDDSTRGAADSAGFRGSAFADMPALRRDLLSKTVYDAGAIPETEDAENALNALPLADKPSGRLASVLVDAKLLAEIGRAHV